MTLSSRPRRVAAVAVATAALAAPAAHARVDPPATPAFNPREPAPVIVRTVDEGFDWGAAAIGAAGAGALVALLTLALTPRSGGSAPRGASARSARAR